MKAVRKDWGRGDTCQSVKGSAEGKEPSKSLGVAGGRRELGEYGFVEAKGKVNFKDKCLMLQKLKHETD